MPGQGFRDSEVYLLHEVTTRLDRIARQRFLDPEGITYPEFLVLMAVREAGSPTQDDVAVFVDMSTSLVSQRVKALVKKGLVRQAGDTENRRRVRLGLTASGSAAVEKISTAMVSESGRVFEALGPARTALRKMLLGLAEGLAREEGMERYGS
jgi:MarR family transcriptional regulator, organic hydroperoxide resistance regulator